jgi:hypothetical protein
MNIVRGRELADTGRTTFAPNTSESDRALTGDGRSSPSLSQCVSERIPVTGLSGTALSR